MRLPVRIGCSIICLTRTYTNITHETIVIMIPHKLLIVQTLFKGGPLSKIQSLYSSDKLILGFPLDTVIV